MTFLQGLGTDIKFTNLLQQYNVPGQSIQPGKFGKAAFMKSWYSSGQTDEDGMRSILTELQSKRTIPVDNGNSIYILFFPANTSIESGGMESCVDSGFCARHSSLNVGSNRFIIMPYLEDGACYGRCGASNLFDAYTINLSHEIAETITNPDIDFATSYSAPLSWFDSASRDEMGDICANTKDELRVSISGVVEQDFAVQKLWSNYHCKCV